MNWKNYLVVVLLCSMILALAFIHNSGSQTTFQYDPWADINDDGIIDIFDLVNLANKYGTTGDPTKTVMHSTYQWESPELTLTPHSWYIILNDTKGYGTVTVSVTSSKIGLKVSIEEGWTTNFFAIETWYVHPLFANARTYPIEAPRIRILIENQAEFNVTFHVSVYMTTAPYVEKAESAWKTGYYGSFNISWTPNSARGGGGGYAHFAGGYSTLFVCLRMTNISETGYWGDKTLRIWLSGISWSDMKESWSEIVSSDVLNITINQYYGEITGWYLSKPISVKGPYFWLLFSVNNGPDCAIPTGWAIIEVYYYMRNG
jgi:hypothetical protein